MIQLERSFESEENPSSHKGRIELINHMHNN